MKKMINSVCVILGFIAVGLGAIGVALPILPTTPFFLLAAALFAKGSERFHRWFTGTRLYKKYIETTIKQKVMTRKAKRNVLLTVTTFLLIGFIMSPVWYAKVLIGVIWIFHIYFFVFRIKTITDTEYV